MSARAVLRLAHLAVPVLLRTGRVSRPEAAYDGVTCALALLALAAGGPRRPAPPRVLARRVATGAAVGAALPLLAGHRPARAGGRAPAPDALRTCLVAAAEEVLWRAGDRRALATVVGVAGFAALHLPRQGRRAAWHLVTGGVLFGCAARGGTSSAVAAHAAHNLVVGRVAAPPPVRSAVADRPSGDW